MIKLRYSPSLRHPICGAASCVSTHGLGVCDAVASGIARFIDQVVRRVRASSCKSLGHPLLPVRLFPLLRYTVYRTPVSARADHLHDAVSRRHYDLWFLRWAEIASRQFSSRHAKKIPCKPSRIKLPRLRSL